VHTDHSAKSEDFEINPPEQEEPAVFDDRGHYHALKEETIQT
jgi:hypothetical protein